MKIEYNIDLEDSINFNLIHSRNSPTLIRGRMLIRITWSILIIIMALIISLSSSEGDILTNIIEPIIFGCIFFLIFPLISGLGMRKHVEKIIREGRNEGVFGKQIIDITPEAITQKNDAGESKYFWNSLDKLVTSPNYIFLYVSSLNAILFPRNSFKNEGHCTEFVELIEQYYSKATGKSLPRFTWKK